MERDEIQRRIEGSAPATSFNRRPHQRIVAARKRCDIAPTEGSKDKGLKKIMSRNIANMTTALARNIAGSGLSGYSVR